MWVMVKMRKEEISFLFLNKNQLIFLRKSSFLLMAIRIGNLVSLAKQVGGILEGSEPGSRSKDKLLKMVET